jgi:hypothetical protein
MKNLLLLFLISTLSYSCSQETFDSCLIEAKKSITEAEVKVANIKCYEKYSVSPIKQPLETGY